MSLNLTPVDPRYLRDVWGYVRAGLERIVAKTRDDWLPEDVYAELRAGQSALYEIDIATERVGFVVLQAWPAYHSGPRVFVRALWGEPGRLAPVEGELYDALRAVARKAGARVMRMNSPRRWDAAGWKLKQYIYEMEI